MASTSARLAGSGHLFSSLDFVSLTYRAHNRHMRQTNLVVVFAINRPPMVV